MPLRDNRPSSSASRIAGDEAETPWWKDAVLYQIYPRSYADSNGDGIGDLAGIASRLDHLEWLGVDGVWLNPIMPSPDEDWGYDVADYTGVHPELGSIEDLERLVDAAGRRGLRVILDLVPNHTSDRHPWFRDSRSSRDAAKRDWYVWADGKDGGPPNNWISVFGRDGAWEYDEATDQWYLHNFLKEQPDLNWWNDEVRDEFDRILRFWFDRGIAGFRIDVAHALVKDRALRDNLPASDDDHPHIRRIGQRPEYNMNRPEVHDVLKRWRALADSYDPARILVGETYVLDLERLAKFYGDGSDELNLAFNFPFAHSDLDLEQLRTCVEATYGLLPAEAWPVWTGSNHDVGRLASRWCEGDEAKIRLTLMMLLCLRGTAFLYYGDEIGLTHAPITEADLKDPVGKRYWPEGQGRDPARSPMPWNAGSNGGFCPPEVEPWLPVGDVSRCNVADQVRDQGSILHLVRDLIAERGRRRDLSSGDHRALDAPDGVWGWTRGSTLVVLLNMGAQEATVDVAGKVLISTGRDRDGERVDRVRLGPWEGVLLEL
jgi:alpha-glucosidase